MSDHPPTGGIVAALVAFQANLPKVGKSSTATVKSDRGAYQYTYADLADVVSVVVPALAAVGIAYTAQLTVRDGNWVLRSQLLHESGETIDSDWPIIPAAPQQMGSALTYGRRYCLLAMTGVHPAGEDDDAATAHQRLAADTVDTGGRKASRTKTKTAAEDDPWQVAPTPDTNPQMFTREQNRYIHKLMMDSLNIASQEQRRTLTEAILGRTVDRWDLTRAEATALIDTLKDVAGQDDPHAAIAALTGQEIIDVNPE